MNVRDLRTPVLTEVRGAYDRSSTRYIDLFGAAEKASVEDRAILTRWARTVDAPVLDAGCGPGHWSAFLRSLGVQVQGVDASAAFVQHATQAHPAIHFQIGDLRSLELSPDSLGGILAWFSLIHLGPVEVPEVIGLFSAALRPGGTLLVGFFSGAELQPFDHAVITAWTWPLPRIERLLEDAGLEVLSRDERPQTSGRVFAEITARRGIDP